MIVDRDLYRTFCDRVIAIPVIAAGLVTVDFDRRSNGDVELVSIWSEVERRAGHGSAALAAIVAIADELGIDLALTRHPLEFDLSARARLGASRQYLKNCARLNALKLDAQALGAWYERHGFIGDLALEHPEMRRPSADLVPHPFTTLRP